MWNARQPLVRWATRGALVDLAIFVLSFIFLGGAHGPIGPLVVLAANYPVYYLVHLFFETAPTSELLQLLLMIVIVTVNGAVYGIVVGFAMQAADRRRMRRERDASSPSGR
jgi:hypothetical protein